MPRLLPLLMVLALAACQLALPGKSGDAAPSGNPVTGDAISVTSLDAAPAATDAAASPSASEAKAVPEPRPEAKPEVGPEVTAETPTEPAAETPTEPAAEPVPPPPPKSPVQLACERKGGTYATAGANGGKTCVRRTRDGGKTCSKESDCEGYCLARSNSCAPITPMFGCNDILQNDGRRVTLCID